MAGYYNRQPLSWWNIHLSSFLYIYTRGMCSLLQYLSIVFIYLFCITDLFFWRVRAVFRLWAVFLQRLLFLSQWGWPFDSNQGELFFWVPASKVTTLQPVGLWTFISVMRERWRLYITACCATDRNCNLQVLHSPHFLSYSRDLYQKTNVFKEFCKDKKNYLGEWLFPFYFY